MADKIGVDVVQIGPVEKSEGIAPPEPGHQPVMAAVLSIVPGARTPEGTPFSFVLTTTNNLSSTDQLALLLTMQNRINQMVTELQNEVAGKGTRS